MSTVLAFIGFLFEEDRVHGRSIDHYVSAVRTRHTREGFQDPCTGQTQRDLLRAFKREDDARGALQDVRAAIPAEIIARIRHLGLQQIPGSRLERDAALIEFQYLMSWRESSGRTVQVDDVQLQPLHYNGQNCIRLSARPRTMKGRLIRGTPATQLTCHTECAGNPLELQARYHIQQQQRPASDIYWSYQGDSPGPQHVTTALQKILTILSIQPPPFSFYSSHSLRSGSVTALVLLGVPLPVIVQRGGWGSSRMVINVYFDGRLQLSHEMQQYFWWLMPRIQPPPPQ